MKTLSQRLFSFIAAAGILLSSPSQACSVFADRMGSQGLIVGKNFDWHSGEGLLVVNPRGARRQALQNPGQSWTARYGSVSFTVIGPGFPVSGMNEGGLVVESLVNASDEIPSQRKENELASLEWGQYILDRFTTVEELVESLKNTSLHQLVVPLHFFVCDAKGDCVVIEGSGKDLRITTGSQLKYKVLANRDWNQDFGAFSSRATKLSPQSKILSASSKTRFSSLAGRTLKGDPQSLDEAWSWLDSARISGLIKWQIVWGIETKDLHYRLFSHNRPGKAIGLRLSELDFTCQASAQVATLQPGEAPVFRSFSQEDRKKFETRFKTIMRLRAGTSNKALLEALGKHFDSVSCEP